MREHLPRFQSGARGPVGPTMTRMTGKRPDARRESGIGTACGDGGVPGCRSPCSQAAGASDRAAARVILVILSILLIPSPAVSRTGRVADSRDEARREERQKT